MMTFIILVSLSFWRFHISSDSPLCKLFVLISQEFLLILLPTSLQNYSEPWSLSSFLEKKKNLVVSFSGNDTSSGLCFLSSVSSVTSSSSEPAVLETRVSLPGRLPRLYCFNSIGLFLFIFGVRLKKGKCEPTGLFTPNHQSCRVLDHLSFLSIRVHIPRCVVFLYTGIFYSLEYLF